jgi:hypothetical protein
MAISKRGGFEKVASCGMRKTESLMELRIAGVQLNGAIEESPGCRKPSLAQHDDTQQMPGFALAGIDGEDPPIGVFRLCQRAIQKETPGSSEKLGSGLQIVTVNRGFAPLTRSSSASLNAPSLSVFFSFRTAGAFVAGWVFLSRGLALFAMTTSNRQ